MKQSLFQHLTGKIPYYKEYFFVTKIFLENKTRKSDLVMSKKI